MTIEKTKPAQSEPVITKKGGKGMTHGVVSELSAFLAVKPGHTEELRAGLERFHAHVRNAPFWALQKFGLTDMRHVIFDNGTRLLWITAFDTDWDPYIDDAIDLIGLESWKDWLQHTVEWTDSDGASYATIKKFLQRGQVRATGFFRTFPDMTVGETKKAIELMKTFEQVLDQPGALEALQQPVLKPLLDKAAG